MYNLSYLVVVIIIMMIITPSDDNNSNTDARQHLEITPHSEYSLLSQPYYAALVWRPGFHLPFINQDPSIITRSCSSVHISRLVVNFILNPKDSKKSLYLPSHQEMKRSHISSKGCVKISNLWLIEKKSLISDQMRTCRKNFCSSFLCSRVFLVCVEFSLCCQNISRTNYWAWHNCDLLLFFDAKLKYLERSSET